MESLILMVLFSVVVMASIVRVTHAVCFLQQMRKLGIVE